MKKIIIFSYLFCTISYARLYSMDENSSTQSILQKKSEEKKVVPIALKRVPNEKIDLDVQFIIDNAREKHIQKIDKKQKQEAQIPRSNAIVIQKKKDQ